MKAVGIIACVLTSPLLFAQQHDEHVHAAEPVPAEHVHDVQATTVVQQDVSAAMSEAQHMNLMMHGGSLNYLVLGERFERLDDDEDSLAWELQGWVGGDYDKLWWKTEGSYLDRSGESGRLELQALYSKAVAPFWDLQLGLRHDGGEGAARSHVVIGLMGLAPYWFELDAAAFVSERGDVSARLEAEYELRFTQRLFLQPRLELNYSFADDFAAGIGQGMNDASFALRLRYELRREFAPYVGVEWHRAYGVTADLLRTAGTEREDLRAVAGIRFWY